jgi:hypothetical protein
MRALLLLLLLCAGASGLSGCGADDARELPAPPMGPPDASAGPDGPSLQARIEAAVGSIATDTCFAGADAGRCEWADYGVTPSFFDMQRSTGEAILVIDDFGDGVFPQLLRFRNRLLGLYRVSGDAIETQKVVAHLPKRLGDALLSFAGPQFIASSRLASVGAAASTTYGKVPLLFLGHGGVIFSHLVDLVPEQPLLLVELSGLLGLQPALCERVDATTLASASAHFVAVASALQRLMRDHDVRFVNASFGDSTQTLATDWSRTCGTAVPSPDVLRQLLHMYDPIYDVLFNTAGVIAAHAAANLGLADDFPFDQVSERYGNRVRIGFISSKSSGLDELGRGTVHDAEQYPSRSSDADVFVNWGCEPFAGCAEPHYELVGGFGLGTATVSLMSSSYATPLGLARLINLRYARHADETMSNALVQTLKQELTPRSCGVGGAEPCVYQDPIAHRQLEIVRDGY